MKSQPKPINQLTNPPPFVPLSYNLTIQWQLSTVHLQFSLHLQLPEQLPQPDSEALKVQLDEEVWTFDEVCEVLICEVVFDEQQGIIDWILKI